MLIIWLMVLSGCKGKHESADDGKDDLTQGTEQTVEENGWQTYTSDEFTFQYPLHYSIEEPTRYAPYVSVKGPQGRLTIGDYDWNVGPHVPSLIQEQLNEQILPQEGFYLNDKIGVALFYSTNDEKTKAELHKIADTIKPLQNK